MPLPERLARRLEAGLPIRAIRYARQSIKNEETISDAIQIGSCDDHIGRNGYLTVGPPADDLNGPIQVGGAPIWEQHTGRVWHKRAGVQRAVRAIEEDDADVIIMWKWNRLSRKRQQWVLAEIRVEGIGGLIESATETADLETSHGRFTRNMMVDLAELQSDLIGDSWRETHALRRSRGLPATGGKRFGYTLVREPGEPERYVPNEDAKFWRWAYALYCRGTGFDALTAEANRRGITNTRGNPFNSQTMTRMLDSGWAAGLLARVEYTRDGQQKWSPFEKRRWDKGTHEAVVGTPLWERYKRERLLRRKDAPRVIAPSHELTGLVRCGDEDCLDEDDLADDGGGMPPMNIQGPEQMLCSRYKTKRLGKCVTIHTRRVEKAVKDWLSTVADEVTAAAERAKADVPQLDMQSTIEKATREVLDINKKLDKASQQLIAEVIPEDSYRRVRDDLLAKRAKAEDRRALAERAAELKVGTSPTLARNLLDEWDTLSVLRRREMLRKLLVRIVIVPSGIKGKRNQIIIVPR